MIDKRLFTMAPGLGRLIAGKVVCLWLSLMADVLFAVLVVSLLSPLMPGAPFLPQLGLSPVWSSVAALVVVAVKYGTSRVAAYCGTEASERVKLGLRERLYRKMLALGPSYSSRVSTADVVQSMGEGVEQIQSFFELFLPQLFFAVLAPLTLFVVLLPVNVAASVVLLVCAPLIVLIVGGVAMSAARVFKKYWGKYTDMGATFLDNVQGLETLQNCDADERAAVDMDEKAEQFRVMTMRVLQIQLRSLTAMDVVAYGGAAVGIGVAIWQCAVGRLGMAGGLLVVLLSASFFLPLRQLGSYFHVAMNGVTSTKRIGALLDAPEPRYGEDSLPKAALGVRYERVTYRYGKDGNPALREATWQARPHEVTAVVGVSGSGKSTAAALLGGLVTGYEGSVSLHDGEHAYELRSLSMAALSGAVTVVSARSHLFAGTVRDNLLMACPHADDAMLWDALRRARVADVVRAHPQGLDWRLEQGASNCSGGQRQRLAIARALLRGSAVYVFDEATSSVDVHSEALIMQAVRELAQSATVVMITHRLRNAMDADHVVVFQDGSVVESGSASQLVAADGVFASLWRAQAAVEAVGRDGDAMNAAGMDDSTDEELDGIADGMAASQTDSKFGVERATAGRGGGERDAESRDVSSPNGETLGAAVVIRRLLSQTKPLRAVMVMACVFGTIGHIAATFLPVFGVTAFAALVGQPVWGMGMPLAVGLMALCALVRGGLRYVEQYMNHLMAFRLLALFRAKSFAALRRLAPAKLMGKGRGDLIALVTTDVELLEIFFAHTISPVVIAVSTTAVYALALATLNPWFVLVLLVSHGLMGVWLPKAFASSVKGIGAALRRQSAALDDVVIDDMRGIREIMHCEAGEDRVSMIVRRTRDLWAERAKLSLRNGHFAGLGGVLVVVCTLAAVAVACLVAESNPSACVVAVTLIASSFGPTSALSALPASLTQTFAAARRLFALMDEAPAVVEQGESQTPYDELALERVTFTYPHAGEPVLRDMSLQVPHAGVLGIRGRSGQGKSTMLTLLMRYWDPQEGRVLAGEVPMPQVQVHHRRRTQMLMSQETYLFNTSIRDNLLVASPQADDEALWRALERASVDDLVRSLPQGLDTPVGELGDRLSEGERQRIGLARVLLRGARLVLLDEPTSRLDAYNEAVVLRSVDEAAKRGDCSVVLVSHRASTLRIANRVVELGAEGC